MTELTVRDDHGVQPGNLEEPDVGYRAGCRLCTGCSPESTPVFAGSVSEPNASSARRLIGASMKVGRDDSRLFVAAAVDRSDGTYRKSI